MNAPKKGTDKRQKVETRKNRIGIVGDFLYGVSLKIS